jgi:NAD(P)-dependent dehydrogenase (short-subunit alcohol dehydrogenase family)
MSKHAVPEMLKRGGGAIVITGSVQSRGALGNSVAYVTSKHALLGLTRAMALDHARENIRVNCVCPGAIDTPMLHWSASLDPRPEKVLEACKRLHPVGDGGGPRKSPASLSSWLAILPPSSPGNPWPRTAACSSPSAAPPSRNPGRDRALTAGLL